jgi:hypothetical protein
MSYAPGVSVQLQFHAEGHEMLELAATWADEYGFRVAAERFFPDYRVVEVDTRDEQAFGKLDHVDRVAFARQQFDLTASTTQAFVNADVLFVSVEWPIDGVLRESALGGSTDDDQLLRTWRRIIRRLRQSMHKGASTRGWTGIAGTAPAHRHTLGAHRLAEQGIRMLGPAGGTEFLFDDLS